MRRPACLIVAVVWNILSIFAETIITGKVVDGNGKPVQAFVSLSVKGSETADGYADVDGRGIYEIEYRGDADSLALTVSGIDFGNVTRIVANRSQTVDFTVTEKGYSLQEVIVKAEKIREARDTLNYNVAAYRDQTDRVIGDVLKKMPGIEVSESGGIKFNGKEIKNFYVENMDLLQNRYGIATNNISAEDVTVVQVMQNHQPIRAMKDLKPSDDVAINLKLRKEAKDSMALTGMVGIGGAESGFGDRLLLSGELTSMYFGKRQQNMTLYKGNNAGIDITKEFERQNGGAGLLYGRSPLNILMPSQPGIAKKRHEQNRSNIVSMNHILKVDSTMDVTANIVYHDDRLRRQGESVSDYYLTSGGRMRISESAASTEYVHHLEGLLRYKVNKEKTYVDDRLNVDANWNRTVASGTVAGTLTASSAVGQYLRSPQLSVDNDLYFLRNLGRKSYHVSFTAGYNQKPYSLTCDTLSQDYTVRTVAANVRTGYGWKWGSFMLDCLLYGDINLQDVKSGLTNLSSTTMASKNAYWFNRYNVGVEQYASLDLPKWFLSVNLPVIVETQRLDDKEVGFAHTWSKVFLSPTAEARYIMGQSWLTFTTTYYHRVDNGKRAGSNIVMHNYRTFQRNAIKEAERQKTLFCTLKFYHKDAYRQFFLNGSAQWLHVHSNSVDGVDYNGIETVNKMVAMPNDYDSYRFNTELNKGFDFWRSTVKFVGNYNITNSKQLIQDLPVNVRSRYWSASAYLFTTPLRWLGIVVAYAYRQSRSHVAEADNGSKVCNTTTRVDMNFMPMQRLTFNLGVEDNYNNITTTNRHCWFGDAKIVFKTKGADYEIVAGNLFNRKAYTRAIYTNLDIFTSTSYLRPRSIMGTIRFKML